MRKVTTINLNNNACQIDEDGYEALRQYLENAERALLGNPDRAEIMADLEQAIADKCRLALGQYKTVVSAAEMQRILKEMGPVVTHDEADTGPAHAGSTSTMGSAAGATMRPRRLYRILDGQKWTFTGVCNGLAAYASVRVDWVRMAFMLLTVFTGGFWLLAYGALVFLLPVANSPEEVAAAHGQPFSAQELVDRFRQKHEDFRAQRRARRNMKRDGHWFAAQPLSSVSASRRVPGAAARVAGGLMLPVLTLLSAGWFAVTAVVVFLVWHAYQPFGPQWPGHWHVADLPRWIPLVVVLLVYGLLAFPLAAGRRAALYYANGGRTHGWADVWSGLLWIALVALLLLAAWTALPQLRELLQDVFGRPAGNWTAGWI